MNQTPRHVHWLVVGSVNMISHNNIHQSFHQSNTDKEDLQSTSGELRTNL